MNGDEIKNPTALRDFPNDTERNRSGFVMLRKMYSLFYSCPVVLILYGSKCFLGHLRHIIDAEVTVALFGQNAKIDMILGAWSSGFS